MNELNKQDERIAAAGKEYQAHDTETWRLDYFDEKTGGYLVTHRQRIEHSIMNKNENDKFRKEFAMSMVLARNGHKIEILEEIPRISSPDIRIDGIFADLKRLSSHNNIVRKAKSAINKQKSDIVIFQFDNETDAIHKELEALRIIGIKVYYLFTGRENEIFKLNIK